MRGALLGAIRLPIAQARGSCPKRIAARGSLSPRPRIAAHWTPRGCARVRRRRCGSSPQSRRSRRRGERPTPARAPRRSRGSSARAPAPAAARMDASGLSVASAAVPGPPRASRSAPAALPEWRRRPHEHVCMISIMSAWSASSLHDLHNARCFEVRNAAGRYGPVPLVRALLFNASG